MERKPSLNPKLISSPPAILCGSVSNMDKFMMWPLLFSAAICVPLHQPAYLYIEIECVTQLLLEKLATSA